jgi:D-arabinose 5-phosphate isomerase GutQ
MEKIMDDKDILSQGQALVRAEADALNKLADAMDEQFVKSVKLVAECRGSIIISGAGTSGAMAKRLAHLLATCGIKAFHIPVSDALHGESAIVMAGDVVIVLSKAGKSSDINSLARIARERGAIVIAWTSNPHSELAGFSHVVNTIPIHEAAEGDALLPFGSTLAVGAFGDALTLIARVLVGFNLSTLAQTHPLGGANELARERKTS